MDVHFQTVLSWTIRSTQTTRPTQIDCFCWNVHTSRSGRFQICRSQTVHSSQTTVLSWVIRSWINVAKMSSLRLITVWLGYTRIWSLITVYIIVWLGCTCVWSVITVYIIVWLGCTRVWSVIIVYIYI